ncbi:M48 family metalloprotease [Natronobiforma cellulositropha]|uniref:M48 family metalloprotease n=1 Tax=Natronobiforma cellulositropha TaxID=1679076 RepID=UPI0021D58BCB|nr:M48 family metalloprotease [Natronobiforma cellulositropha]
MTRSDLTAHIGGTLALVLAVDFAFALFLATLFEPWFGPSINALVGGSTLRAYAALVALIVFALVWAQLLYTRHSLLAEVDATPATDETHPDLLARVTRLAALADMRVPTVAVADTDVPNSFAIGGVRSGTVVVSEGLLESLESDELETVLAHELVHLKNHDAAVMTLASFLPALVSDEYSLLEDGLPSGAKPAVLTLGLVGWFVLSATFIDAPFASPSYILQFVVATGVVIFFGGVALGVLATPVVFLSRSLSRQREFVADRDGARLTGNPGALVRALQTLDDAVALPTQDARKRYDSLEGMCFLPHGFLERDEDAPTEAMPVGFRTHPPTEDRIERLRDVAAELETAN